MLRFLCLVAALFSLASGFTVAPALRGASSQPAVRMAAAPLVVPAKPESEVKEIQRFMDDGVNPFNGRPLLGSSKRSA